MDLVGKRCGGKLGWSDLSIPCQKLCVRYYNTLTKTADVAEWLDQRFK
jgi:hypothetical protein